MSFVSLRRRPPYCITKTKQPILINNSYLKLNSNNKIVNEMRCPIAWIVKC